MQTLSRQVKLGLTIIVGIVLAYLAYSSVTKLNRPSGYTVFVEFDDARGISKGTSVRRAGTDVGWVDKVSLDSDRGIAVAEVKIFPGITFPRDAIFFIVSEGLIEEKYLSIRNNPKPDLLLGDAEDGDKFNGFPDPGLTDLVTNANEALVRVNQILEVATSFMSEERLGGILQDLLAELNSTIDSARVVLEHFDSVLGASQGDVTETLENVKLTTANLQEISGQVKSLVEETDLPNRVSSVLDGVDSTLHLINRLMLDLTEITSDDTFKSDVKGVFHEGRKALEESQETLKSLRETLKKVEGKIEEFPGVGVQGKVNIRNESTHRGVCSDNAYIDVKTRVSMGENTLDLGVDNLGEDTPDDAGVTLQAGKWVSDSLHLRGGVYRDELGLGFDIQGRKGHSLSLDAFNLNNPTLNSYFSLPIASRLNLLLGVEDVGDTNEYNAGIQVDF